MLSNTLRGLALAFTLALGAPALAQAQPNPVATEMVNGHNTTFYGKKFKTNAPLTAAELPMRMKGRKKMKATVTGPVNEVCQAAGCWLTMDVDGKPMRVWGYEKIFIPKDSHGKTAVVTGHAVMETTTVAELRHYAEDAGKSEAEVAAITEPKEQLVFRATGIALY